MTKGFTTRRYLIGIFKEEDVLVSATAEVHRRGILIHDVFTPYAVHGLDEAMGIKRSRLPWVTLIAGIVGALTAILFQTWVFTVSWPMNIGGKPHNALPAFIPVTFEFMVLIGGLISVAAFFIRSRLYPGGTPLLLDARVTDDRFVLAISNEDASLPVGEVRKLLKSLGAEDVRDEEVMI